MGKRILITGASGFIGGTLMKMLADTDSEMFFLVRQRAGLKNEIIADFCDPDFYKVVNALPKVDVLIHLGAKIGWDGSSRESLFKPNVLATAELVNWAKSIGAYFVFASAAIVCGVKNTHITFGSAPNPDTDYGYSKWLAEEIILMSGVKHAILRISGVFGKDGPSHLGINKAINGAMNGITPVQYGSGKMKRNYIYVEDLCKIIIYCIENQISGIHLVAGSSVNTISEMLEIICSILLPDRIPERLKGEKVINQTVEHSSCLPKGRSFRDAIKDIKRNMERM